ncbi:MAG: lysophospholipid acyltransferase family protein [Epsilonproteobacteria bacterium]|nr:lysophospholipid acyltransferase family protein [Campylobacterota bacterium]
MKKKISRALALFFLPFIGSLVIRFLYFTNKKVFHIDKSVSDAPTIFATWHGDLLMLPYLYYQYRKKPHAKVLISDHFDGLLISKTIRYFGLGTIAGSTNRNAVKALIQGIKALKEGYDIGITPDGPKGPRHQVSDGVIVMAQKAKADVVMVAIKPTKYWQVNSWDKFKVPKPFGTIHYYAKKVSLEGMELETARKLLTKGLLEHES